MNANVDWDEVRTFLAISRAKSLNGAARALGVHHSTVYRRLERLEAALGAALFERDGARYRPTAAGEAFEVRAARVEDELFALQRAVLGNELMPTGTLRITTLESLLPWVLPALSALEARCPDLTVELDASTATRALDRRDADMAVRPADDPPEDAIGRRIGKLAWASYAPRGSGRRRLAALPYVGSLERMQRPRAADPAARAAPPIKARTVAAMAACIAAGVGTGDLPCYVGDTDHMLERVGDPYVPRNSALWLLLHPDLRDSARIRAVLDLLVPALSAHAPLFAGACPHGRP